MIFFLNSRGIPDWTILGHGVPFPSGVVMQGAPASIGRYQILSELGQGAMGVVYLAQDPTLKRKVAIKCMKDKGHQHNALERFHREAETSSRLNHPNIITVYDVGDDPEIGPFMAMEFVEGTSLGNLIKEDALSREAGFQVLTQLMYGLMAAHAADIIHRDVKPDNLLVGKDGRVKLMDFGIARGEGNRLTTVGVVVGTPSFTAPEVLLGKDASFATDQYAFVVTAFEVMTGGALPFKGDSLGTTLYRIVHEPPVMPPGLEPEIAAVFQKALEKDSAQRYQGLGDFMAALAKALGVHAPVMPTLGAMPGHGAPSGVGAARASQDDLKTPAASARKSHGGSKVSDSSAEMGHHLAPPPQGLLTHKSSGERTPQAPSARPLPPRARVTVHPAPTPKPPTENILVGRVMMAGVAVVLLVVGGWGWRFYANNREHAVKVISDPPFAQVWVDGVDLGTTPCNLTLKVKAKRMLLSRMDYEPLTLDLSEDLSEISKSLKLRPGYFRVLTEPREAQVYLNGEFLDTSPIWSREYQGKAMELRVEKTGYETRVIQISPEKPPSEPLTLKPKH